ncbi:heme-binding protein [Kocuria flava]|uniref:Heme-binding protein n=1 Tax=Kocuria flava TaxID=446860 RepID=A0A0U2NYZ4_9MICC|nr:heme-binding protein [Kocuria flava]ALU39629.1 heme-binding protein [Kocuria flava]GEO92004.1 heme-binding protein [Kocuria flava]
MVEQQPYSTVRRYPAFELRHYPELVLAEVEVTGPFEGAANSAFNALFRYISGHNRERREIPMTAPVVQEEGGSRKIAMTAPVWQRSVSGGEVEAADAHVVAFVLPAALTAATAPVPSDPAVRVRVEPAAWAAVLRYRGRWTRGSYERHRRRLERAAREAGLVPVGAARFARFNPPFTPPLLRRNEVVLPVGDPGPETPARP